jgi:hypothetical protein
MIPFALLSDKTFGYDFQGAIAYNFEAVPDVSTGVTPYFMLLAGILTNNVLLTTLICAAFVAWIYFLGPRRADLCTAHDGRVVVRPARSREARLRQRSLPHPGRRDRGDRCPVDLLHVGHRVHDVRDAGVDLRDPHLLGDHDGRGNRLPLDAQGDVRAIARGGLENRRAPGDERRVFTGAGVLRMGVLPAVERSDRGPHDANDIIPVVGMLVAGALWYFGIRAYRSRQGLNVEQAFKEIPIE